MPALAAADVLELFSVRAGTWVRLRAVRLVTAEGAAGTIGLGDGATASGYRTAFDLNGTPGWFDNAAALTEGTPNSFTGFSGGKLYTAADTVDALINTAAINVAVVDLVWELQDFTNADVA